MKINIISPEKGRNRREGLTMTTMTMTTTIRSNKRYMHTKTMVTAKTTTTTDDVNKNRQFPPKAPEGPSAEAADHRRIARERD